MESTLNIQNKSIGIDKNMMDTESLMYAKAYREKENSEVNKKEIFFDDLQIMYVNNRSNNRYQFTVPQKDNAIIFHYQFSGIAEVISYFGKLIFKPNEQNVFFSENKQAVLTVEELSECCLITTTNKKIVNYFTGMEVYWASFFSKKIKSVFHTHQLPVTFYMRNCIEEMLNSGREGFLLKLHLESLILKLILLHFEQIENHDCQIFCSLKKIQYNKMCIVKKIIMDNLNQWFTISELACRVGTNECSLKKGFKEVFGLSVFEFAKKNKMEKAYSLLCDTDINISSISEHLGYKNHTHFSAAFKKNFGISPKDVRQLNYVNTI